MYRSDILGLVQIRRLEEMIMVQAEVLDGGTGRRKSGEREREKVEAINHRSPNYSQNIPQKCSPNAHKSPKYQQIYNIFCKCQQISQKLPKCPQIIKQSKIAYVATTLAIQ